MTTYWLIFSFFLLGAFLAAQPNRDRNVGVIYWAGAILIIVIVGLRFRTGGDWFGYDVVFESTRGISFSRAIQEGEPGYWALNWVVNWLGLEIWLVNLVCAVIFTWGLFRLCAVQSEPWAAVLVAVPYLVIVVAIGYTRQSVALGFLMAGLASVIRGGSSLRFAVYVLLATLFHRTAIIVYPIVAPSNSRNKFGNLLLVVAVTASLYDLFLSGSVRAFMDNYIRTQYSSQGAGIRIAMCLTAAFIYFANRKRLVFNHIEMPLWRNFSLVSLVAMVMLVLSPSSTAVDRLSLYILPLQVVMWAQIPLLAGSRLQGVVIVGFFCFAVQFTWLNFAQHADSWVPYRMISFGPSSE